MRAPPSALIRCAATSRTARVRLIGAAAPKSSALTRDIGALKAGVAPWQVVQCSLTMAATSHGTALAVATLPTGVTPCSLLPLPDAGSGESPLGAALGPPAAGRLLCPPPPGAVLSLGSASESPTAPSFEPPPAGLQAISSHAVLLRHP